MKHQTNEKIDVAGSEFVVSKQARKVLRLHIGMLKRKNRFNPRARTELLEALRDVLLEVQKKPSSTIDEKQALDAIAMAGDSYETASSTKLILKVATQYSLSTLRRVGRIVSNPKLRIWLFSILAFSMLVPLGLAISISPFVNRLAWDQASTTTMTAPFETNYGYIRYGDYADRANINPIVPAQPALNQYASFVALVIVIIALMVLFILLAKRSRYSKFILAVVIVALVSFVNIGSAVYQNHQSFMTRTGTEPFPPFYSGRKAADLDTLYACGAEMQMVFGNTNDGMFYTLRDAGFELKTEFANRNGEAPAREQLCTAYNELRKTHANEDIVLQSFLRDASGEIYPTDLGETQDYDERFKKLQNQRDGFFVRKQN